MRPLSRYHRSITHPALLQAIDDADRLGIPDDSYQAFHDQFASAKRRKIEFLFSLLEWWTWWQTFDTQHDCIRWERRGVGTAKLVMARFDDVGPYSPSNVYCATHSENIKHVRPSTRRQAWMKIEDRSRPHLRVRGDGHPKSQAMMTPAGRFGSGALAAEHYGLTRAGAKYRADRGLYGWSWEQP